jgi:hypothetical protein
MEDISTLQKIKRNPQQESERTMLPISDQCINLRILSDNENKKIKKKNNNKMKINIKHNIK